MAKQPTKQEMDDWFKIFDTDGSGKIDIKELKAVVRGFYEWQEQRVDDAKIDADVAVTRHFLLTYLMTYLFLFSARLCQVHKRLSE